MMHEHTVAEKKKMLKKMVSKKHPANCECKSCMMGATGGPGYGKLRKAVKC